MTTILDDLETESEPKCIGRCSIIPPSSTGICGKLIYANEIDYVEQERGKGLICGSCVTEILRPRHVSEEPEKDNKKFTKRSKRTGARLPQGEDLKK